ncbi:type II toxin-antitoxin system VapC family toxin [Agromyces soli]
MRALLDTHVLLWWLADDPKLAAHHRELIADADNEMLVSSITVAEVSIKASLGKLDAPTGLDTELERLGFTPLALTPAHAEALRALPWHHRDPFDRMLVAQAMVEGVPLLSADARLRAYPPAVI